MSNQDTGKMVGLGVPKAASPAPAAQATAPASGLTGLGAKGGLTGLGTGGGLTGLGSSGGGGLTGLGGGGGLTGLGSGGGGGLTGLGAAKPVQTTAAPAAAPGRRAGIAIDTSAAERIQKLLADRGTPDAALRIRVRGGGCTGMQYDMEFADEPKERDRVFSEHGVKVIVDPKSYIFLIGTVLTYQTTKLESGFKLENPNAKKSCGCGESFTI